MEMQRSQEQSKPVKHWKQFSDSATHYCYHLHLQTIKQGSYEKIWRSIAKNYAKLQPKISARFHQKLEYL